MPLSIRDLQHLERAHQERLAQERRYPAVIQDSSDLPAGKVRVYRTDIRQSTVVNGLITTINLPVFLEFRAKELQIVDVNVPDGTQVFGDALPAKSQPSGGDETVARSVTGLQFTPGRVEPSTLGYPFIHVRSFDYDDGVWDDGSALGDPTAYDFSIAPYVTAPSGYSQWILLYFDPDAGVLLATANTPVFGDVSVLDEAQIDTSAIPAGMYPLGAVKVANGQTAWAATDFASKRIFLSPKGVTTEAWNSVLTDHNGNALSDHAGNLLVSR